MDWRRPERTMEDRVGKRVVQILSRTQEARRHQESRRNARLETQSAVVITCAAQCCEEQDREHNVEQ
jgi:hypothetical protein